MKTKRRRSLAWQMLRGMACLLMLVVSFTACEIYDDAKNRAYAQTDDMLDSLANQTRAALTWLSDPKAPPAEAADGEALRQRIEQDAINSIYYGDNQTAFLLEVYDETTGKYIEQARSRFLLRILNEDGTPKLFIPLDGLSEEELVHMCQVFYRTQPDKTLTVRGQLRGTWLYPGEISIKDENPFPITAPAPQETTVTASREQWSLIAPGAENVDAMRRAYQLAQRLPGDWENRPVSEAAVQPDRQHGGDAKQFWVIKRFEDFYRYDGAKMRLTLAVCTSPAASALSESSIIIFSFLSPLSICCLVFTYQQFTKLVPYRLTQTAEQARHIAALDFDAFAPDIDANDEIGDLNRALKDMADTLREKWDTERDLERKRQEFVAAASHDLKTPLALISGYAEAVGQEIHPTENARYLASIEHEAEKMSDLVREMLDYTKLDRMERLDRRENIDLCALVRAVAEELRPAFAGRRVEARYKAGVRLRGDEALLRRAVVNVLSNAAKFTPADGRVEICVRWEGGKPCLTVENQGEPIAENDLSRIFEMFYRGDKARTRDKGGNGVGLAIAQRIFALHGLEIRAENTKDGVKFTVWGTS